MSQRVPRIIGSITWQLPACWDLRHREKYLLFSQKDPLASCDSGGPALPLPLLAQYSTLSLIPPDVRFFFLQVEKTIDLDATLSAKWDFERLYFVNFIRSANDLHKSHAFSSNDRGSNLEKPCQAQRLLQTALKMLQKELPDFIYEPGSFGSEIIRLSLNQACQIPLENFTFWRLQTKTSSLCLDSPKSSPR
ncbi:hypothetical protein V6N11_000293 [Hibiscus sabdariffa]|uniref:Uncharacterized protein n=1 Tax=Hibiscus sabdariffa TaxID=183260 RepID=A0ABR2NG16_9ROSI